MPFNAHGENSVAGTSGPREPLDRRSTPRQRGQSCTIVANLFTLMTVSEPPTQGEMQNMASEIDEPKFEDEDRGLRG